MCSKFLLSMVRVEAIGREIGLAKAGQSHETPWGQTMGTPVVCIPLSLPALFFSSYLSHSPFCSLSVCACSIECIMRSSLFVEDYLSTIDSGRQQQLRPSGACLCLWAAAILTDRGRWSQNGNHTKLTKIYV